VLVAGALVAEERPVVEEPRAALDQDVPVVVTDLVAEVPEQRPVGLVQVHATALALDVVGSATST
jgi:hypothetical protein